MTAPGSRPASPKQFGRAEGQPAAGADHLVQVLQVDRRVLERRDEEKPSFLSLRNRFLVCAPGMLAVERPALLDGEERRMGRQWWSRCRDASRKAKRSSSVAGMATGDSRLAARAISPAEQRKPVRAWVAMSGALDDISPGARPIGWPLDAGVAQG